MSCLVDFWLFTTPIFYQGAVLLKGRTALDLSNLEFIGKANKFQGQFDIIHGMNSTHSEQLALPPNPSTAGKIDFDRPCNPEEVGFSGDGVNELRRIFHQQLIDQKHPGAQFVLIRHGRVILELASGWADRGKRVSVSPATPFLVFSIAKSITAMCVHKLIEEGIASIDDPVCKFWPEFAQQGKDRITIRMALTHQAGIPRRGMAAQSRLWSDWQQVARNVAALPLEYPAGTRTAYHTMNFGFILGEVLRRATGKPVGELMAEWFFKPLGMSNSALGLPNEFEGRAARIYLGGLQQLLPYLIFSVPNIRKAALPSVTLHAAARDLAVYYQMLLNGGVYNGDVLLNNGTIQSAVRLNQEAYDHTFGRVMRWAQGFSLGGATEGSQPEANYFGDSSSLSTFGHAGQGTCLVWADTREQLVMVFTCNRLLDSSKSQQRWKTYSDAVWRGLL